ncbi:hypothetical protein FOYG_17462 [Fusarium oxysporum NRRL 32931]|uniref:Uncharacterized protein n=1 Tax=Fusarium oxysporum NRRL 32931 TaxID=660029 RepID=W9HEE8_FUSOX|nr:hypothetical protein FOYG_17462 [Fusarium oxysporum NRRL 32931]
MDNLKHIKAINDHAFKPHALQRAVASVNIVEARMLLSNNADPNERGEYYGDPLSAAAFCCIDCPEIIKALLEHGASPNSPGGERYGPPLSAAAAAGNIAAARFLLDAGADVNARGGRSQTALQAVVVGHGDRALELAGLLLDWGADATVTGGELHSALCAAFRCCSVDGGVRSLLLERTLRQRPGKELLHRALAQAASVGDLASVRRLAEAGADVNVLSEAAESRDSDVLRFLLDRGADANRIGGNFGTALAAAAYLGPDKNFELLLERGSNVNVAIGKYGSPLQAAAYAGNHEYVKSLLSRGADISVGGGDLGLPLHAAVYSGSTNVVKELLDAGSDVNAEAGQGGTALQVACAEGSMDLVVLLIDRGADINTVAGFVGSALAAAIRGGHIHIAEFLLDHGADPYLQFQEGKDALSEAKYWADPAIVKLIIDRIML